MTCERLLSTTAFGAQEWLKKAAAGNSAMNSVLRSNIKRSPQRRSTLASARGRRPRARRGALDRGAIHVALQGQSLEGPVVKVRLGVRLRRPPPRAPRKALRQLFGHQEVRRLRAVARRCDEGRVEEQRLARAQVSGSDIPQAEVADGLASQTLADDLRIDAHSEHLVELLLQRSVRPRQLAHA
eukprot:CAMPEP_0170318204 /NCGR_PEP_ID=MMETSP0116_2-20130129/59791_1 /TAXON_ID=400756 /ORGANISM="Durinskia baltica, Strain CSIRO CS-38" /LENGTH=183 /DNA_ID=CAMNT_0010570885 /DNA_START=74 /DNA_END=622 /DNA_ORIENTATION=+